MEEFSSVSSVVLNSVSYPSWPRFVPPPSANIFSYSAIKCRHKFYQIFLYAVVLLCHGSMAFVQRLQHFESLIIAQMIILTSLSLKSPSGCAISKIWTSSAVQRITSTGQLQYIGLWMWRRYQSRYFSLGVPYNLLRRLMMTGGLLLPNPCLAMPVFVSPPEFYYGSMARSNI